MRRAAAAIVLLAAAVLLHFATPHHSPTSPSAVSVMAPAVESEGRKLHGPASALSRAGAGTEHHESAADALARPPRAAQPLAEPPVLDDATGDGPVDASAAPGSAQPRTARDSWNPSAGIAPTPSTLQTFRC
ncbi:hypothetical protein ABZ656_08235 [Streptomyces sp. NPDC007095]|jgi:hypothetical protein|uniref:hypothetical protein n=1 Tax=Streptomyces sp. NPDC007095 TaxID=3154482 RepID=UPI000CA90C08